MASAVVRISDASRKTLRELSARESRTMQEILERAIEGYRRERFLEEVNAAYAALRQNSKEWKEMQAERRQWETTLGDGLEDNRPARPTSGGRGRAIGKKK